MAAISMGMVGSMVSSSPSSRAAGRKGRGGGGGGVRCSATASGSLTDQYRTLRIQPDASETEVKKAYRQLALQYHPDVCKGRDCGVQFHRISEAYDIVISSLRAAEEEEEEQWQAPEWEPDTDEPMRGMCDSSWDMWEEWMGWEGAGIRDYSSHINPYI